MNTDLKNYDYQQFEPLVSSGRSLVFVVTFDEVHLSGILTEIARQLSKPLWTWQVNRGLRGQQPTALETQPADHSAEAALDFLLEHDDTPIVWFKDLHRFFSPGVIRRLRDLYEAWKTRGGMAVVSGPERAVPAELEREMVAIDLDLPSVGMIRGEVEGWLSGPGHKMADTLPLDLVSSTLRGLTLSEVRHALNRVAQFEPGSRHVVPALQEEKRQLVQKTGTLEYVADVPPLDQLGGLEELKEWLLKRKEILFSQDQSIQEIAPKGILLMGVSGCGKSLCIKAISSAWQLPLYRLEMVRIFSGGQGNAELSFAEACKTMEKMAPAVLWFDEIEMGLSAGGSTAVDPMMSRIFAFFLTWMQEKPAGLFVAATANRIDLLPAEMIRKGRFDQVFFVDLPTLEEREMIFRIHLEKRGYDADAFELEVFADSTKGWSGAEIEQCVIAAITSAKMEHRDLVIQDLYRARKQIVPISLTMEEQVRHIRNWAYERAIHASKHAEH